MDPMFQHRLAEFDQCHRGVGTGTTGLECVEALFDVRERPHAMPFSRRNPSESEMFSCTPTWRGDNPSARPSNCVK